MLPSRFRRLLSRTHLRRMMSRGAFRRSIRPTDTFLVTYPKSGTTWLAFMLANLIKADPSESLNLKSFLRYVPDINQLYFSGGASLEQYGTLDRRFFLVHAEWDPTFPRVVYVVRDPRDVLVSYYHFHKLTKAGFSMTIPEFVRHSDDHWPCPWEAHVAGWLDGPHPPLLVKYEEMHADAAGVLRRVAEYAGVSCDESALQRAVEAGRFDRMQSAENKHGVDGALDGSGSRFIRKGVIGGWREEMAPEALAAIEERCGPMMDRLGYDRARPHLRS